MSPAVNPVLFVMDLLMKYTVEMVTLHICILCGLLSCDSSPICKRYCHVFMHYYTDDDSERQMDYELSLLPNGFSTIPVMLIEPCQLSY